MEKFSRKRFKKAEVMVVASIALFVGMVVAASLLAGLEEMATSLVRVDIGLAAGLLALSLVNYGLRGLRWHLFGQKLGVVVPLKRLALYYSAGFSMVTTPGKIGTVLRLWFLKKCHRFPYSRTAPLMFMDQLTDSLAMLFLALAGFASFSGYGLPMLLVATALVGILVLFRRPKLLIKTLNLAHHLSGRKKPRFFAALRKILRNITRLFSPGLLSATTGLSIIGWGAEALAFHWLLTTLGAEVSFLQATFIFAFSTIVGAVSMLPGGLGSAEAVMFGLLVAVGVAPEVAVVATAIIRLTTLWFGVFIGFSVLPFAMRLARRENK